MNADDSDVCQVESLRISRDGGGVIREAVEEGRHGNAKVSCREGGYVVPLVLLAINFFAPCANVAIEQ